MFIALSITAITNGIGYVCAIGCMILCLIFLIKK